MALLLLCAIAVVLIINPVGFIGGPRDDARYLEAARCWVEQGACLPTNHWQGRWPVFAPVALLIALFGESRFIVQLWPLVCSTAALLIFSHIVGRIFGSRIAISATLLLLFSPAFALQLLRPNVETIEFALVAGAVGCALVWQGARKAHWAFAAGLCFGLAFQVRETSIIAAALVAGGMMVAGLRPRPVDVAWAAAGFLIPLAVEFAMYHFVAGDWLYRRQLSLAHVQIHSDELNATIDRSRSPILNPDYIANWRREMGVHLHWLIDGPLNLILSPGTGFSLLLAPVLLIAGKRSIPSDSLRMAWWPLGLAAIYIALLTYMLAIDPKSRIMLIPIALGSLALAVALTGLFDCGRKALAVSVAVTLGLIDLILLASMPRMAWAEQRARAWIDRYPNSIATDGLTRSILTLDRDVRAMPGLQSDRPLIMIISDPGCDNWIGQHRMRFPEAELEEQQSLMLVPARSGIHICLFKRGGNTPAGS